MDYFLTSLILLVGVGYFIINEVSKLKVKYPALSKSQIFSAFFSEEWDSLIWSGLVLISWNIFLYVCEYNQIKFAPWFDKYGMYVLPLILGWGGQRIAYKSLTTVEGVLDKKIDQLKQ